MSQEPAVQLTPSALPIYSARDALVQALTDHQAVVVEGPTGCGKTTQIPQMLLESGLLDPSLIIGVTQPRRLAAVSVAHRIAAERSVELGREVGYAIRFDDVTSAATRIKVMTDGLLLQEARTDPELSRYGLIMVDEAHERSLNIDFTLGLLRRLIDRRPELRVVISSATINAGVFTQFFGGAPRVAVDARTYPIDVRWQPLGDNSRWALAAGVADVVQDLHLHSHPGDVLVFLTGEGAIKSTITELERRRLRGLQLLPLYGRLTRQEQERVFDDFPGKRKVVIATNIAETSITIDGVRYVVDLGLAKVPSYDPQTGIATLHEEPISRASANQRTGRAGRTGPGLCVRLYGRDDFKRRTEFPVEEVLRMDLSEVVLRLIDLGVTDVEHFPFVTRPPRRLLKGAVQQLQLLRAIDRDRNLTEVGRRMVPFPLPPRLSRMVVEAADNYPEVLDEVLTVGALLSVRWPQIMPQGEEDEARAAHKHFADPLGDLVAGLRMVRAYRRAEDKAAFCGVNYLDQRLMDEVLLVREQLSDIARVAGVKGGGGGDPALVVRCLATAFARAICQRHRTGSNYETATGVKVSIHPGSCLYDRKPRFLVAADIVVTSRAWARAVSEVAPEWIVEIDPELAAQWRVHSSRRGARPRARSLFPSTVSVFGREFRVKVKRKSPMIEVPVALLVGGHEGPLPDTLPSELTISAVVDGKHHLLTGMPLRTALRVMPLLHLHEPEIQQWPEGVLYEADRDHHSIMRHVSDLLRLVRSRRRGRPAFLTLIFNGAGGFWYDAARDLSLAAEQSRLALTALMDHTLTDADDLAILTAARDYIDSVESAITVRKSSGRRARRARR